jgi:hypothetical protein
MDSRRTQTCFDVMLVFLILLLLASFAVPIINGRVSARRLAGAGFDPKTVGVYLAIQDISANDFLANPWYQEDFRRGQYMPSKPFRYDMRTNQKPYLDYPQEKPE